MESFIEESGSNFDRILADVLCSSQVTFNHELVQTLVESTETECSTKLDINVHLVAVRVCLGSERVGQRASDLHLLVLEIKHEFWLYRDCFITRHWANCNRELSASRGVE